MKFFAKRTSKRDSDEVRQEKVVKTKRLSLKRVSEKQEKAEKKIVYYA